MSQPQIVFTQGTSSGTIPGGQMTIVTNIINNKWLNVNGSSFLTDQTFPDNGLASVDDVHRIVFDATYLVLGLGDVYLGAPLATPLDSRMIVTPGPVLASIPNVLAVAYGTGKCSSVLSVLRGKVINGLVTHTSLARALLETAGANDRPPAHASG